MRALNLTNLGSGWVVSTPPNGGTATRAGRHDGRGGRVPLERTGKLVFYTGFAPLAGEQIAVSYRTIGRAVGRAVNTASQQALAQAGSACRSRVDRFSDESAGAQFCRTAATRRWSWSRQRPE